jgi:hypothetical protein
MQANLYPYQHTGNVQDVVECRRLMTCLSPEKDVKSVRLTMSCVVETAGLSINVVIMPAYPITSSKSCIIGVLQAIIHTL